MPRASIRDGCTPERSGPAAGRGGGAAASFTTSSQRCISAAASLPRVSMDVERPLHARVTGLDLEGAEVTIEASGLEARVLQHEIDHLDGVLFVDRLDRDARKQFMAEVRAAPWFASDAPPTVKVSPHPLFGAGR